METVIVLFRWLTFINFSAIISKIQKLSISQFIFLLLNIQILGNFSKTDFHVALAFIENDNLFLFESLVGLPVLLLPKNTWIENKGAHFFWEDQTSKIYKYELSNTTIYEVKKSDYNWEVEKSFSNSMKDEIKTNQKLSFKLFSLNEKEDSFDYDPNKPKDQNKFKKNFANDVKIMDLVKDFQLIEDIKKLFP
jgi:hypothetical protein